MTTNNSEEGIIKYLHEHHIKPTAMRILVLRCLMNEQQTLSLRQIEEKLHPADRSTIFRTLTLFEKHHLIHSIDDGSGATRYEMCHSQHDDTDNDQHAHFRCTQCGNTICLQDQRIPQIELPQGYTIHHSNYIIIGVCPKCSQKTRNKTL